MTPATRKPLIGSSDNQRKPHFYYPGAHPDALQHSVKVVVSKPRDLLAGGGDDKYTRQTHVEAVPAFGGAIVEIRIQGRNHD